MKKFLLISLSIVLFMSCKNSTEENLITFDMNGETRQYILHIPESLEANSPLVFVLHGLGGSAYVIMNYSQMNKVADQNRFAVCYPQGTSGTEDTKHTKKGTNFWNVGYEIHKNETVDDVEFLTTLAAFLQKKYNLNPEKTFCTGMSNGGDMSYLLGCTAPDIFVAIAPVAGCMMGWIYESCADSDPVPVFKIHGTADQITLWAGDVENKYEWGPYMDVESTFELWVNKNKCTNTVVDTLPDLNTADDSFVISEKHTNGINGNEVWFYKIVNGGHEWPPGWPEKSGNMDVDVSKEIWNFFQHSMKN